MRTTLDIEDDVLQAAKELAAKEGSSAGRVISELARKGLNSQTAVTQESASRNGVPVLPPRGEVVTMEHVQRLMDEEGV